MNTLSQASHQWATRPADERFTSLPALAAHCDYVRHNSRDTVLDTRQIRVEPVSNDPIHKGLVAVGPTGNAANFTHWSFGQLSRLAGMPVETMRKLPAPLAADCLNFGLQVDQPNEPAKALLYKNGGPASLRALTGPNYGRIWNADIAHALVKNFGDGITGKFRVPGEFGKAVEVNNRNTTIYASDRDMFVFLADEENRIEIPNRRDGKSGSLARGFFVWNSEVGKSILGVCGFLFDYVCQNRTVWGVEDIQEIRIRHTSGAPERFMQEIRPALVNYANSSTSNVRTLIASAQASKIGDADAVTEFLRNRFTMAQTSAILAAHMIDEQRPVETLWDASVAVTAYARGVQYQDARIELEREGGKILKLAA